jgi:hypothetical protein
MVFLCYEKATKLRLAVSIKLAKPGIWLIGGGIALIVAKNLMEKAILSSGKTKIR